MPARKVVLTKEQKAAGAVVLSAKQAERSGVLAIIPPIAKTTSKSKKNKETNSFFWAMTEGPKGLVDVVIQVTPRQCNKIFKRNVTKGGVVKMTRKGSEELYAAAVKDVKGRYPVAFTLEPFTVMSEKEVLEASHQEGLRDCLAVPRLCFRYRTPKDTRDGEDFYFGLSSHHYCPLASWD